MAIPKKTTKKATKTTNAKVQRRRIPPVRFLALNVCSVVITI